MKGATATPAIDAAREVLHDIAETVVDQVHGTSATQRSLGFDSTHGFLGEEFLLWLWFRFETEGGEFRLGGGRVVGIAIDDLLQFAPDLDDDVVATLRHGLPTKSPEARAGLRQGHRIGRARVILAEGARQWSAIIDGETLAVMSARLPDDAEDAETAQDRTADRSANWLMLHEILGDLFAVFLRARSADGWLAQEGAAIAAWMKS